MNASLARRVIRDKKVSRFYHVYQLLKGLIDLNIVNDLKSSRPNFKVSLVKTSTILDLKTLVCV